MKRLAAALFVLLATFGMVAVPASAAPGNSPAQLAGCFGHNGIHASGLIMYECIFQPPGLGGALYWSANESQFLWDKHPGTGLDWVAAATLHPATDANPPNTAQAFWVGIKHNRVYCTVINPGYDQHPTRCEENGRVHPMTAKQQASYDQFAAAMTAANLPDCAWSMTASSNACDIDS